MNKILDLIFVKFPNWLDRCADRMEQKAKPEKQNDVYLDVTDKFNDESEDEQDERLKVVINRAKK